MGRTRVQVGDIFEIPLSNGRKAYGQYVFKDRKMGPLIRVFALITQGDVGIAELMAKLKDADLLFGPVFTGLFAAVRTDLWKVIGHFPVQEFTYPGFLSVLDEEYKPISHWYLWDGETSRTLGQVLPDEYKHLELLVGWSPHDIAHRIETGENPYEQMIKEG